MALKNLTLDRLILWTGCAILLLFFLPASLVMLWRIPNERESALVEKADYAARSLSEMAMDPLLTDDIFTVAALIHNLVESQEAIHYVVLLDTKGRVIAHTLDYGVPSELLSLLRSSSEAFQFRSSEGPLLDVPSPLMEGALGTMHLGLSLEDVISAEREVVWTAMILLTAALAVLLIGVHKVSLLVSRPLSELDSSTRRYFPSGDEEGPIPKSSGTLEVRAIAARFSSLLQQLASLEKMLPLSHRNKLKDGKAHAVASVAATIDGAAREDAEGIWSEAYLEQRYDWLVFHRWVAIGGIILAWLTYLFIWQKSMPTIHVAGCVGAMGLWNLFLHSRRRWPGLLHRLSIRIWLLVQVISDLIALTLLLHLFGGMENPFKLFYVFLMVIAGLTFHLRVSGLLALLGSALYGFMVVAEMASFLPHRSLFLVEASEAAAVWRQPRMVLGEVVGMTLVQLGVVIFVHTVSMRRQKAEAARKAAEAIALSRERMAILGELAAGVAHEVRNPIHGLLNCCAILQEKTKADEEQKELVSLLDEGLRRISGISDRLLRLSHPAGLRKTLVDVTGVVSSTLELVRESARKRGVSIEFYHADEPPLLIGDSDRLSEAVLNLLNNSLDAMKNGGKISLRLESSSPPGGGFEGGCITLMVSDTGSGIPLDILPRIFDPFFTSKAVGEGSGLGLSLVRETVHNHGGSVEIESEPGTGTTVTIMLPAAMDADGGDDRET
jgi:signal transduction histidine kinase